MRSKFVAATLSALLYAQALLGFAALASVILKDRSHVEVATDTTAVNDRFPL
jgi:hypothetical protein